MAGQGQRTRASHRDQAWAINRRWTAIHIASLVGVLALLVYLCRGQWFFGDEWDFILFRGFHHARWGLLRPHNEHWSTIPILWYRAAFSLFGLKSYWPYMLGLFATHLVVVHSGWRIMRRVGVGAPLATGVALVMGLFGAGSENLTWAFQVGFVGSLAAGLLLVLAVDRRGEWSRVALVALGTIVMLMFSGISVVMVGAVGLTALARWGWQRAAAVVVPATGVYLLWLKVYGSVGLHGGNSIYHGGLKDIPRYVWGGLSDTLGEPLRSRRVGEALLVALIAVLVVRGRQWWRDAPEVLAVAAAAPVMFAVISQGRGAIQDPSAGRYLYLTAGMVLPLIAYAVDTFIGDRRVAVALSLVACLGLTASGVDLLRDHANAERTRELTLKGQMLASIDVGPRESFVSDTPDFTWATDVRVEDLRALRTHHKLPTVTITEANRAQARLALQITVIHKPQRGADSAPLSGADADVPAGATLQRVGATCVDVDLHGANLVVRTEANAGRPGRPNTAVALFTLAASTTHAIQVFVPFPGGNAGPRNFAISAGENVLVQQVVQDRAIYQLPPGVNRLCGIKWTGA